jgi:hypothetical protein
MSKLYNFSDTEFSEIVKQSYSYKELGRKLGYNCNSSDLTNMLKDRIEKLQLDISHFSTKGKGKIERSEENIFIENSTADQSTLRRWYKQGEYTPYICSICGQEPIWQNKELTLILDHINGNNKDDRLENLRWVCPNCNQQLPTTNGKNKTYKEKTYCIDCQKEISKGCIRCRECSAKYRTISLDKMPVTREKLKDLIRTTPFTKIGEMYQVSDNSIRKWCDKFNLPRKVSDIKKYTDEEWKKI